MGRKPFSNYLDKEYSKMESELKTTFEGLDYIATTADIWSVHNRSFLGMTAHWINIATLHFWAAFMFFYAYNLWLSIIAFFGAEFLQIDSES